MYNRGQLVEDEFILQLNDKKVAELNDNLRYMLEDLFGVIDRKEIIKCKKADDWIKPDVLITYQDRTKGLSIKNGKADTFHTEQLKYFVPYLRSIGVSERSIKTLLLFQFGDGTTDGTGNYRMNQVQTYEKYKDRIKEFNEEMNENDEIVSALIDRFLFAGVNPEADKADAVFIGDAYNGVCVTKKQMMKFIKNFKYDFYNNPHVGPILLIPAGRNIMRNSLHEEKRLKIVAWWPKAENTFYSIARRYSNYTPLHHRTYEE